MATRLALVTEAARRLGDQSAPFLTEVDAAFPFVIDDMAAREAISELRKTANFTVVLNQEDYSTATMVGSTAPDYPLYIEKLYVPSWGMDSIPEAENDTDYDRYKQGRFNTVPPQIAGTWQVWRLYPNEAQIQVWPPADADHAGANLAYVTYVATPTINASGAETAQIRRIFQETVVYGLMARSAEFKDETADDFERYWQLYLDAVNRIWGQRFNHRGGRIPITDAAY